MIRGAAILLCIAATWTLGALTYYRPRRCRCGGDMIDRTGDEEEDVEPLSMRPRALWAKRIGR